MDAFWAAAGGWWVQAATSGGAVLLLGWLASLAFHRPAVRQAVGAWAIRGAVLAAGLSALPHWVLIPRPAWMTSPAPVENVAVHSANECEPTPSASEPEAVELISLPLAELPAGEPAAENLAAPATNHTDPKPTDTPVSPAPPVVPLLMTVYFAVAGVLLLQLVIERLGLAWLLRDAVPLNGRARRVFDHLTAGERPPVAVVSTRVRSPLCVGIFRPLLVLPRHMAENADEPTLRCVLAHELDHLRRGDTRTAGWVGVARAVFFFVPWFWLVRRDLSLCQEYLADAAAVDAGASPADYAAFLVDLSGDRRVRRPLTAAGMKAGRSDLFRRVHMLLTVKTAAGASRRFRWLAGAAAVTAAVGLAGLGFADEPKKDAPKPKDEPKKVIEIEKVKDEPKRVEQLDLVGPSPAELQKKVEQLVQALQAKGGTDPAALADLVKLLEKQGVIDPGTLQQMTKLKDLADAMQGRPFELRLQPPAVELRGGARVAPPQVENELRKQYDQQLKDFDERIKKAADAEAKEQLEKARDEYKKAMEEPLKKADAAQKDVDAARRKLDEAERVNRDQNADAMRRLAEMQRQMQQRMLEDMKKLEDLGGFKRMELFPGGGDPFSPVARNVGQPRLGVKVEKVSAVLAEQLDLPKDGGLVVAEVTSGSAAEKAGLKKNDVLLKIGDKDVPTDPEAFTALVGKLPAGDKLDAVVLRKGKKETVKGIELPEARQPVRGGGGERGVFERGGRLGGVVGGGGDRGGNESVQIQINNDDATLQATVGDVNYTVTGTVEKGKLMPTKIVVKEGKESKEYESLDKMPEGQRKEVERLMGKVRVAGGR